MNGGSASPLRGRTADGTVITAELLSSTLDYRAFVPFLIASTVVAAAYGTSFLLPDYMDALETDSRAAGHIISSGMATTLVCCYLAGWLSRRIGLLPTLTVASLFMALAMLAFAGATIDTRAAYGGGLLVGAAWSVFFILAPLQLIRHLRPSARIQYLTFLSGSQMAGLGLAAPLGHLLARYTGSLATIYTVLAIACLLAAVCVDLTRRAMSRLSAQAMPDIAITLAATTTLLQKCTALPVAMIAISACIFAGLSTYQSAYSASHHLNSDLFFLVFTSTSVVLRFSVAHLIGSLPLRRLAFALILMTAASLVLFLLNGGSTSLYIVATVLFAAGYGLSYSTLNTIAVNLAGEHGVSVPTTSQIFTLAYFLGLFGFPMVGGQLVLGFGPDVMLLSLLGATALNAVLATRLEQRTTDPSHLRKELTHAD
ncbi:MFS transporter [Bradyrhizobium sp. CCGE-LA001]|uniref:MFS transporter n=1 Tax=Bradyrhizobium sp. CCGE-LA001 TaxID=1223566 RepID=UPI000745B483|nr:MFS transporter [Bradyrhizobium sp. CCGE-LA001]AMA60087.1 hypothetical protein BCCGELA001_30195 [Bradyrhizobium sp. CCGE-LA001]